MISLFESKKKQTKSDTLLLDECFPLLFLFRLLLLRILRDFYFGRRTVDLFKEYYTIEIVIILLFTSRRILSFLETN